MSSHPQVMVEYAQTNDTEWHWLGNQKELGNGQFFRWFFGATIPAMSIWVGDCKRYDSSSASVPSCLSHVSLSPALFDCSTMFHPWISPKNKLPRCSCPSFSFFPPTATASCDRYSVVCRPSDVGTICRLQDLHDLSSSSWWFQAFPKILYIIYIVYYSLL